MNTSSELAADARKFCRLFLTGFLPIVLCLAGGAPHLRAQVSVTATLSGIVTDPTGAVVQDASVTIINEATNETRTAVTNKVGVFASPNLNPSTYSVKVVAKGFTPYEITGIAVHAGDDIKLPTFSLAIGATTDTVTVTSVAGQILTTENGQRSVTLTYEDIQDLALTSRDTSELLKVLPGVVQVGNNGYNALSVTTGNSAIGNGMGINGAPYKGGTAINMDGASILDIGDDFSALATINPEMTQEVQVMTSAFGADTANGPNVINTTGKSGGDRLHGEGWFVARNDVLNANDWQDNHHLPLPNPKGGAAYYYPGGNISGPVPHTNHKLFYFGGFEMPFQNQGNANIVRLSIPTPEMLQGNFSMDNANNRILCPGGFVNSASTPVGYNGAAYSQGSWCQNITQSNGNTTYTILPDGSTPAAMPGTVTTSYGSTTVVAANGGYLPSQFIDPNMLAFAKIWPAWNSPYVAKTTDQIIANGGWNYLQTVVNHDNGWIARGRIDFNWNERNQFYISYQQGYDGQLSGGCGMAFYSGCTNGNLQYPGGGLIKNTYSKVLNGHYVHTFSPTLTNEALASWVWGNIPILPGSNPSANFRSTLGANIGCVYCSIQKYMPTFSGSQGAYPGLAQNDYWEPNNYYIVQKAVVTFADNLTKVWGRHTLKFGFLASNTDNYQGNQTAPGVQGALSIGGTPANNFNYFAASGTCSVCGTYTGKMGSYNNSANFLMGNLTNYQESNSSPLSDVAYQTFAVYADDQIKVNKKLSVQVGLRFEHIGWWYDRQGTGLAVFYAGRVLSDFYAGKPAPGFYWHGIDGSLPLSGRSDAFGFLSPRFGLSYDVFGNGKTLVRGGYGAYRYQEAANGPQAALNTAQQMKNFSASTYTTANSTFLLSQINQLKTLAPNCQVQCASTGQSGYDPNDRGIPLTYSYNFTIDQRLPWNMLLDVGYVGNRAIHMADNGQDGTATGNVANQNKTPIYAYGHLSNGQWVGNADPFTSKTVCNPENLNATCTAVPGSGAYDFQPFGRATGCTNIATSNNPNCLIYGTNTVNMIQHNNYQNYNALQVIVAKRAGPVTINANATWSKSLGTVVNWDPYNVSNNNTYTNLNRPFVFNSSYIWRVGNLYHGHKMLEGAVNGWTISGITLWQQGTNTLSTTGQGPTINIQYDPASITAYNAANPGNQLSLTTSTRTVGQATFFGTNAGIVTARPQLTCDPKSGLVKYQLYRPCFTAAPFGSQGGYGLPFIAGQAFMENDLSASKTFTVHERHQIKFTASAFNWLNHPLPTFGSGESTTEYYFYNFQTHALSVNDTNGGVAPGSANPGSPIVASNVYGNANNRPQDLFGTQHFKQGFGGNNQRIMEFQVKYSF